MPVATLTEAAQRRRNGRIFNNTPYKLSGDVRPFTNKSIESCLISVAARSPDAGLPLQRRLRSSPAI